MDNAETQITSFCVETGTQKAFPKSDLAPEFVRGRVDDHPPYLQKLWSCSEPIQALKMKKNRKWFNCGATKRVGKPERIQPETVACRSAYLIHGPNAATAHSA